MITSVTGQPHAANSPTLVKLEAKLASVKAKVRLGNVDEAINETAIGHIAALSGKLFNSRGEAVGGCLRISPDLIITPFHCTSGIRDGTVQFFNPHLLTNRICHVSLY